MPDNKTIEKVAVKASFAEAEEMDVAYYASIDWKESAANVEIMRKSIWKKEYETGMEKIFRRSTLKEENDDFK
jgi:predicted DNA-binding protein (UPF0251 family)